MTNYIGVLGTCRQCGSPALSYLCNDDFIAVRPEASNHDYWSCCSNVLCSNHQGEAYLQFYPSWVNSDRTTLVEQQQKSPTKRELFELLLQSGGATRCVSIEWLEPFANAVLERWSND